MLESELNRLQSSWPDPLNTMEVRGDLEALLYVMTKLGAKFPLIGAWSRTQPGTLATYILVVTTAYHCAKVQSCLDGE